MSKRNNFFGSKSSYTARTLAFLAATGITDTTIANALNTMDLALIANGLDVKMKAIYPFVGGTATTHKFNFMNPADTDAAYRLVFAGGLTHSSTGVLPNGINGTADTKYFAPAGDQNSFAMSYYSRTTRAGSVANNMGRFEAGSGTYTICYPRFTDNLMYGTMFTNGAGYATIAVTDTLGLLTTSRTASNITKVYKRAVASAVSAKASIAPNASSSFKIFGNFAGGLGFESIECAFASLSSGLSDANVTALEGLVQTFNTSLSRQV